MSDDAHAIEAGHAAHSKVLLEQLRAGRIEPKAGMVAGYRAYAAALRGAPSEVDVAAVDLAVHVLSLGDAAHPDDVEAAKDDLVRCWPKVSAFLDRVNGAIL